MTRSGQRPPSRRLTSSTRRSTFSGMRRPTTTARTRRLSGSSATWSHWSPRNRSPRGRFFSLQPTNAHFSSNWTAVVRGGKGGLLVVQPLGVGAGEAGEAQDGVAVDADEAAGLAGGAAVGDVGQDGPGLVIRKAGVEQGGALALGEAGLARAAVA